MRELITELNKKTMSKETKEQILLRMDESMPFSYSEKIRPYILEAMQIYADQQLILSSVVWQSEQLECECDVNLDTIDDELSKKKCIECGLPIVAL